MPIVEHVATCNEAAIGLERGTRGVRDPEKSVLEAMRVRCDADRWSPEAVECFAKMDVDDLATCAGKLDVTARNRMFDAIDGGTQDEEAIAEVIARLDKMAPSGINECDRFVRAVARVMSCRSMPLETRVQLGNETVDFWSLPTNKLSVQAQLKMAQACGKSLGDLQIRAGEAGCMP